MTPQRARSTGAEHSLRKRQRRGFPGVSGRSPDLPPRCACRYPRGEGHALNRQPNQHDTACMQRIRRCKASRIAIAADRMIPRL